MLRWARLILVVVLVGLWGTIAGLARSRLYEFYSSIAVTADEGSDAEGPTPSHGPAAALTVPAALNCSFWASVSGIEDINLAYSARWWSPEQGVIAHHDYGVHKPYLSSQLGAEPVPGLFGEYKCEVDWFIEDYFEYTNQATLRVIPKCGTDDPRNDLIAEYYNGQYGVTMRPQCSDFQNSGPDGMNFSWSQYVGAQASLHGGYVIARSYMWPGPEGFGADAVQDYYPYTLTLISGYRCPHHNRDEDGRPNSRHQYGDAIDIKSYTVPWNETERDYLANCARAAGATYIESWEDTKTHVHADWRR